MRTLNLDLEEISERYTLEATSGGRRSDIKSAIRSAILEVMNKELPNSYLDGFTAAVESLIAGKEVVELKVKKYLNE